MDVFEHLRMGYAVIFSQSMIPEDVVCSDFYCTFVGRNVFYYSFSDTCTGKTLQL
ncbi:hypothetical protein JCM15548_164 [Geofilum rubicundum JCM 15548]|uniref:Uncharacterized protein n=1 Tax=Geofilum rubicundum JCM 15548 TaxID=1236989 RepID=A0A0E9LS31_9BACT|nr:hypothetical protein JCM15548_164 [Geofilum rubicundum JCM 15548]